MEMCEDIFEKHCVIEYKKRAEDEEVEICNEVFDRTCDEPGPEVCEPVLNPNVAPHITFMKWRKISPIALSCRWKNAKM